ncbi:MAG: hypothetical protein HYX69_23150 [Planctomycetia bacterium]|nr:hypothetical protein [Planctomycetia bacterium]
MLLGDSGGEGRIAMSAAGARMRCLKPGAEPVTPDVVQPPTAPINVTSASSAKTERRHGASRPHVQAIAVRFRLRSIALFSQF